MLSHYLSTIILPQFLLCCQKYNIEFEPKNTNQLIVKSKFADYQFNGLTMIVKKLGEKKDEFTNDFLQCFTNSPICDLQMAGPFVNIVVKNNVVAEYFKLLDFAAQKTNNAPKNILIDYSSPNIAKELHVGHLRSTIIGDSLANLYEYFGHNVMRVNHIGDWGSQFGMVIAYANRNNLDADLLAGKIDISQLMSMYQKAKELSKTDNDFKNETKKYVLLLQSHDPECMKLWEIICSISRDDYQAVYQMLNIKPIKEVGESFYNQFIPKVIEELKHKGLLKESNGAMILEAKSHPLIMVKSDGGYTYDTTDVTAIWYRTQILKADEIIYLTDAGQRTHFEGVFEVAQKMGWCSRNNCKHLGFGLVLKNGTKISSRAAAASADAAAAGDGGGSIKLKELLSDAIEMAMEIWQKKASDTSDSDVKKKYVENRDENGYIDTAINSVKYYDLSHQYQSDYNFNKHEMVKFDGNTATYVMYIYARLNNILKKKELAVDALFVPVLDVEKKMALSLFEFDEVMEKACYAQQIHLLVKYVYDLADNFSSLWGNKEGQIIDSPHEQSRLLLCSKIKKVFEIVFGVLGMKLLGLI